MKTYIFVILASLSLSAFAGNNGWRIIPGKRIGQVTIGMERAEVIRLLGLPNREDDLEDLKPEKNGEYKDILRDDWTVPVSLRQMDGSSYRIVNFVTVYFHNLRVVQIEVSDARFQTMDGFSVKNTPIQWAKRFLKHNESHHQFSHQSAGGIPATKVFVNYDDVISDGISWYYNWMGDLAPDPDLNRSVCAVVVHKPHEPVIIDPDGGDRFIYKEEPKRLSTDR